jgi:hypothetical protein
MPPARAANVIAFRTYAVLLGALAAYYLFISFNAVRLVRVGLSQAPFGGMLAGWFSGTLYALALGLLVSGVISAVLTPFAWRRSVVAASIGFVLWILVIGTQLALRNIEFVAPIIAAVITVALALPLAAAIATRRRAHPTAHPSSVADSRPAP